MSDGADDAALLQRWTDGDAEAGRTLTDRYFGLLYRFFLTKAPTAPEDLAQATFLACLKSTSRFDPARGSFRAFALGIAWKELLVHRRKHARESRALQRAAVGAKLVHSSPSGQVARRRELKLLLRALRQLPLEQQILIELYYWEELSVAELAAVMGTPAGTIKSRLWKARDALRDALHAMDLPPAEAQSTVDNFEAWAQALRQSEP